MRKLVNDMILTQIMLLMQLNTRLIYLFHYIL